MTSTYQQLNPFPTTRDELQADLTAFKGLHILLDRAEEMMPIKLWIDEQLLPALPLGTPVVRFNRWLDVDWFVKPLVDRWDQVKTGEWLRTVPEGSTVLVVSLGGAFENYEYTAPRIESTLAVLQAGLIDKGVQVGWLFPGSKECLPEGTPMHLYTYELPVTCLEAGCLETLKLDMEIWYEVDDD